jgi:hypothetical protein
MKKVKIQLNEKEVEIKALPFRKVLEILKYIKTLPVKVQESISEIEGKDAESIDKVAAVGVFAELISESSDEIIDIIATASGIPAKEVGDLGMADMIKLFKALLEVNDIEEIKKELGGFKGMFNKKTS